jgi:PST family polysaccharide transporter
VSLRIQTARGLKWQAIEIGGRQVLSLAVFATLARLLDPAAFGLVGLVGVYLALVQVLAEQGIGAALVQRKTLEPQHLSTAFWFNILCACILCAATMLLAEPVARMLHELRLVPLLRWASLALVINAFGAIQGSLFAREMNFRITTLRTFVGNAAGGAVGVAMALAGSGVWSLIGQQLAASVAAAACLWIASSWRPSLEFSWTHLKQLMRMSVSVFGTSLLWCFTGRADQLFIGRFLGASSLGQFAVADRLGDLAKTSLYQPLGAVALPALSKVQDDRLKLHAALSRAMEVNTLLSFPALLGLSAVATNLIPLLLGQRWQPAGAVLQLIAIYVLLHGLQVLIHYALLATGHAETTLGLNIVEAIGVLIACVVGVRYGIFAVVLCLIVNDIVMYVPRLYCLWTRTGFSPVQYLRPCIEGVVAAGLMYGVVVVVDRFGTAPSWRLLLAQISSGVTVYLVTVSLLSRKSMAGLRELALSAFTNPAPPEALTSM